MTSAISINVYFYGSSRSMKHTVNSKCRRGVDGNNGNDGDINNGTQGWRRSKGGKKQLPYDPFQMRNNSKGTT